MVALLGSRVQWIADNPASVGDVGYNNARRVGAITVLADSRAAVRLVESFVARRAARLSGREDATESSGARPDVDWAGVVPTVTLHIHIYSGEAATDTIQLDGHGPVAEAWVRECLGPGARFTIRPVSSRPSTPTRSSPDIALPCIS